MTRFGFAMTTYFVTFGTGLSMLLDPTPKVIWNATPSVPVGLYSVESSARIEVGDLVAVETPASFAPLFARRDYLPMGVPLLKPVAAIAGSTICRRGNLITIDGRFAARALDRDHLGRRLPVWQGCHSMMSGEVFLLATARRDSLDGRYFGPVLVSSVIGTATPLWLARHR